MGNGNFRNILLDCCSFCLRRIRTAAHIKVFEVPCVFNKSSADSGEAQSITKLYEQVN